MSIQLKDIDLSKLSAGMRQYAELKLKNMDSIVFFRLGDFYEMFFEDAVVASRDLEIALTGKDCGLEERAPMCGVPFHACDAYIKKLIEKGHRVVICEQLEDPATAKGIVKRDVVRKITAGTVFESDLLDESKNNWLCSIYVDKGEASLCFADISTGEAHLYRSSEADKNVENFILNLVTRFSPVEIICSGLFMNFRSLNDFISDKLHSDLTVLSDSSFEFEANREEILSQFSNDSFVKLSLLPDSSELKSASALFSYISQNHRGSIGRFTSITLHADDRVMDLDFTARNNLEISKTMRNGDKRGSLLWVLDKTKTSMGKRLLKTQVEQPLISPVKIINRLNAVEAFANNSIVLGNIRELLSSVYDLERLMTKIMYRTATPNDIKTLSNTALKLPEIKQELSKLDSELIFELNGCIYTLSEISNLVENAIHERDDSNPNDNRIIKEGFSAELDEIRNVFNNGASILHDIEERERERTGIKNLKIGYNRVFGYYLEVTRSFYDLIPQDYIRKQTLTNAERFITEELKNVEDIILGATDKIEKLESEILSEIKDFIASKLSEVQSTATAIAQIDVLQSLATVARENNYTKPEIAIDGIINIKNGRHPVVEHMLKGEIFIPNDAYLDLTDNRMSIITGPNMSGKSTYMRQVALITLMAQIGSFVPADYAKISVVDRIFTRVGASDDLSAGQSTFMVEMSEVADIIKNATKNSLVILDEVGRGTSTFDGISIAQSVAEYIANPKKIGCKTLFATHYHELIELENTCNGVKNYSVAVKRHGDSIRFLRKIVRGGVDESYGIEVAKLAGLPQAIINRSREILSELEAKTEFSGISKIPESDQLSLTSMNESWAVDCLRKTNIDELSDDELRDFINEITKSI